MRKIGTLRKARRQLAKLSKSGSGLALYLAILRLHDESVDPFDGEEAVELQIAEFDGSLWAMGIRSAGKRELVIMYVAQLRAATAPAPWFMPGWLSAALSGRTRRG